MSLDDFQVRLDTIVTRTTSRARMIPFDVLDKGKVWPREQPFLVSQQHVVACSMADHCYHWFPLALSTEYIQ